MAKAKAKVKYDWAYTGACKHAWRALNGFKGEVVKHDDAELRTMAVGKSRGEFKSSCEKAGVNVERIKAVTLGVKAKVDNRTLDITPAQVQAFASILASLMKK